MVSERAAVPLATVVCTELTTAVADVSELPEEELPVRAQTATAATAATATTPRVTARRCAPAVVA